MTCVTDNISLPFLGSFWYARNSNTGDHSTSWESVLHLQCLRAVLGRHCSHSTFLGSKIKLNTMKALFNHKISLMQIMTQSPWVCEDALSWFQWILDKAILSCMVLTALTVFIYIHVCVSFFPSTQSIFPSCSDPVASVSVSASEVPVHFTA